MTILKVGDKVRVKQGAYNIADQRWGMEAKVTRIDVESKMLPVRIEYDSFAFNWTNHESLELVEAAPSQHAAIGKDILDRMLALKGAIATRDDAIKTVVEQTEALDALLASVGLKRGEEIPPFPVRVTATTRTALDDVVDGKVEEGNRYTCTSDNVDYYTKGKTYTLVEIDDFDDNQPIAFRDDDRDESYPDRHELAHFIRVQ